MTPRPSRDPQRALAIAEQRIAEEAQARTGTLDLHGLGLDELPASLFTLTHLRELDLGGGGPWEESPEPNRLDAQRGALATLIHLEVLSVARSDLTSLAPFQALRSLQCLDCCFTQVADLGPLVNCINLQSLDCSVTEVTDLAPLSSCTSLRSLDCSFNEIADLAPLSNCTNLQFLRCTDTEVADLAPLSNCTNLQSLVCSRTQVANLAPLSNGTSLQSLDCSGTQVADLAPLSNGTSVQSLDCSFTQVADLAPLSNCTNLQSLNGTYCQLHSLPSTVLSLPALRTLRLYKTSIPEIPPAGVLSTSLDDNCLHRVRAHFADLAAEAAAVPSVKLLLIGNGGAGKTQVARRLAGEPFDPVWNSTHGIEVGRAVLPGDPEVQLHIWDFGGQDIYHGAHALFLTTPAVIAAVWATDTEAAETHRYGELEFRNQPLPYWIDVARHQGHAHSPLLIVQTQCDRPENEVRQCPTADGQLEGRPYAKLCHVSAKTGRGFGGLRDVLADAVAWLREPGRMGVPRIGAGRLRVQRRLEALRDADQALPASQRRHRLLNLEYFAALCAEEGGVSSPEALLTYLDAEGTVLYRPGLFQDRIVLDQNWALEAVYAVFERDSSVLSEIRRANGRFTRALLGRFVWQAHNADDQDQFIRLMQSCGICFEHRRFGDGDDESVEYIAPDLLPEQADPRLVGWDGERAGEAAVFRYPLLHGGLMRTIMAAVGEQAGPNALYWRNGLCGFETNTGSRLLIGQEMTGPWTGEIHLRTQGGRAADLLERLVKLVERAEHRIGLRHATAERPPARPIEEETRVMSFSPPPAVETEWYVSYAWGDKTPEGRKREKIVDKLCAAAESRGQKILRDKEELGLGDSISAFMRRIGGGSRVFVILSDKYLRSPHCMFELSEIWRTSLREDTFLERVRVYALPDTKIWDARDWADWAIHWKTEYEDLDARARQHGAAILGRRGNDRLRQMQFFYTQVADILGTLADIVQPRTVEDLERYGLTD